MPKDFSKQGSKQAVGLPASGKSKAVVRKHSGGGKTSGLGGGKAESKK